MSLWRFLRREWIYATTLNRVLRRIKGLGHTSTTLVCDDFEAAVDAWPLNTAMMFEGRSISYRDLDAMANRFAHFARTRNLRRGDVIALVLPNRIEYFAAWLGFTKVGVIAALINPNLTGAALAHSLAVAGAHHVVTDATLVEAIKLARGDTPRPMMLWALDLPKEAEESECRALEPALRSVSSVRPDRALVREDLHGANVALFIYTSGTTGLPKAAKITHSRAQLYMRVFSQLTRATAKDRIYVALPLYHSTGGLCGLGAAFLNGGTVVLKRKFSASQFWDDICTYKCTQFVYVGELCRYLVNQPECEAERSHGLTLAFGNGMRPDVWRTFKDRFKVKRILEFYGSTEGNVSTFNLDGKLGSIGRIPSYARKKMNLKLVRFDRDADAPQRDGSRCVECSPGEVGEAIGEIKQAEARFHFTGYADKQASDKKILRDVFKPGDLWFRTGDLMRQDREGYYYFIDRIGDTYRWKAENVSTAEVEERLSACYGVLETAVYGVPVGDFEGKAGMASITPGPEFTLEAFSRHVDNELPPYARPVFVRLMPGQATTGTFKFRKVELIEDGFDPKKVGKDLFYRSEDSGYQPLTAKIRDKILKGEIRI